MMNKGIIFVLLVLSCISGIGQTRVIEKPLFTARTVDNVEIKKVVLGDRETVITLDATACKGRLTQISKGLYLLADGQRYELRECRGVILPASIIKDSKIDEANPCFDLVFDPLPASVRSCDLIFYKSGKGLSLAIWDIQLTKKRADVLKKVPSALKKYKFDATRIWQKPVYRAGHTRLEIHLLGYTPEMGELLTVSWGGLMPGKEEILVNEEGMVVLELNQYVTTCIRVHCGKREIGVVVDPGEQAELYIDLREANLRYSTYFRDGARRPAGYYRGNRMDLNQRLLARKDFDVYSKSVVWDKNMSVDVDGYIALCLQKYRDLAEELEKDSSLSEEYRYYTCLEAQLACVGQIQYIRRNMVDVYGWGVGDSRLPLITADYFTRLSGIDLKNYDLMLVNWSDKDSFFRLFKSEEELKTLLGEGYISDLYKAQVCQNRFACRLPLREKEMDVMRTAFNPDVVRSFEMAYAEGPELWKAHIYKPGYRIREIPKNMPGEQVFEEILSRYRGQVVFVDFWGTSCVPCVKAMKIMQPVKKEFKKKPVAYVFLTSESSPEELWQQMIPNIGGDHYRLTKKQDRYLVKHFGITGVPYYILVGKDGKITYQTTGFMGCEKMRELLKKELKVKQAKGK